MVSLIKTNQKQDSGHELLFLSPAPYSQGGRHLPPPPLSQPQPMQPPVQEDAADVVVRDGRLLGAGGHAKRPQEVVDQDVELLDVFGLGLQHAEHHLVPLPHAFGVGRTDVVLDDGFPLPAAEPTS